MGRSKTIILDCDGVLTDGKVYYTHTGERTKGFHSRDIRAIRELISHGFEVIISTQSSWPGLYDFAHRTGATVLIRTDKLLVLDSVKDNNFIAVGDDVPDLEILQRAYLAFCPADADMALRSISYIKVLKTKGGEGVIAELINELTKKI